jgi:hypothetical protein
VVADWVIAFVISLTLNVVSALIRPRPKQPAPAAIQPLENPTADAGREIPKIFGRKIVKSVNVIWYGDKASRTYEIRA